jgi:hypothetical protein
MTPVQKQMSKNLVIVYQNRNWIVSQQWLGLLATACTTTDYFLAHRFICCAMDAIVADSANDDDAAIGTVSSASVG